MMGHAVVVTVIVALILLLIGGVLLQVAEKSTYIRFFCYPGTETFGSSEESGRMKRLLKLPYPVLVDESGLIHRNFGATDSHGRPAAAVYVTDRYLEVFAMCRTQDGQALPTVAELLNWLVFINSQCPECEPPEWPV